jgi:hypothetical protein
VVAAIFVDATVTVNETLSVPWVEAEADEETAAFAGLNFPVVGSRNPRTSSALAFPAADRMERPNIAANKIRERAIHISLTKISFKNRTLFIRPEPINSSYDHIRVEIIDISLSGRPDKSFSPS